MKIIDCVQGTEEWHKVRLGMPTASNFDKLITTKGLPSKSAKKYMYKVAGEFITGIPEETYQSAAMIRGNEIESEARSFYEMVKGTEVKEIGFVLGDPDYDYGCSPDGFVGDDGMIQIKCPIIATHVGYLLNNKLPTDYFQQVQGELFVTGRKWSDFISYYPGLKPLIVRVERDEKFISTLTIEVNLFCDELKEIIKQIK